MGPEKLYEKCTSVLLAPKTHESLKQLAKDRKVSISWIARDLIEKYLDDQLPKRGRPKKVQEART